MIMGARLQATPPASLEGSSVHTKSRTGSPSGSVLYGNGVVVAAGEDYFSDLLYLGSPNGTMRQSVNWEMFDSLNRPPPPQYDGTLPRRGGGEEGSWPRQYLVWVMETRGHRDLLSEKNEKIELIFNSY